MTFKNFIMAAFFRPSPKMNIWKSVYFNFKVLPARQAIHLPIHLYGKWNFRFLRGKIKIPLEQVKFGSYRFGFDTAGYFTYSISTISIHKGSKIELGEGVRIGQGVQICLYPNATLRIGNFSSLGDNVKCICYQSIVVGKSADITWDCQITDFNSHYMLDRKSNSIPNICKPVNIGDYCWICNKTLVMPGTILANRVVVAASSLLNRNYIKINIQEGSLIGGIPAKLIKTGVYRIYNREDECSLKLYFKKTNECRYKLTSKKNSIEFEE